MAVISATGKMLRQSLWGAAARVGEWSEMQTSRLNRETCVDRYGMRL